MSDSTTVTVNGPDRTTVSIDTDAVTMTARTVVVLNGELGPSGPAGADGADGVGVPAGGTTGQVLAKASATNYDTEWVAQSGGGSGRTLIGTFSASTYYSGPNRAFFPDPYATDGSISLNGGTGRVVMFFGTTSGALPDPNGYYHYFPFDPASIALNGDGLEFDGGFGDGGWWDGSNYLPEGGYRFPFKLTVPSAYVAINESIIAYTVASGSVYNVFTDANSTYFDTNFYAQQPDGNGSSAYVYPVGVSDSRASGLGQMAASGAVDLPDVSAGEDWYLEACVVSVQWPSGMPSNLSFVYNISVAVWA